MTMTTHDLVRFFIDRKKPIILLTIERHGPYDSTIVENHYRPCICTHNFPTQSPGQEYNLLQQEAGESVAQLETRYRLVSVVLPFRARSRAGRKNANIGPQARWNFNLTIDEVAEAIKAFDRKGGLHCIDSAWVVCQGHGTAPT
jgi:hypothetical protein